VDLLIRKITTIFVNLVNFDANKITFL